MFRAHEVLRDEVLVAFVAPELRDAVTAAAYSRDETYLPAGATFEQGLFAWESALLERPELPRRGRVLLAGAGGGREAKVLADRGYEVLAFEPVERYCTACIEALGDRRNLQVVCASYDDLLDLARNRSGPLAGYRGPFDLIWLGWGSFAHVTVAEDQTAVLTSLKTLAPNASIVLSFFMRASSEEAGAAAGLRRKLRWALRMLGGRHASPGIRFWPWAGFAYAFTRTELRDLFRATGYSPAVLHEEPYPHALLVPENAGASDRGAPA